MRTTLTLDEDVARGLIAEVGRSGRPFEEVLNELLRQGLEGRGVEQARQAFTPQASDLGALRPGLGLDNVGGLLDSVEGPTHR